MYHTLKKLRAWRLGEYHLTMEELKKNAELRARRLAEYHLTMEEFKKMPIPNFTTTMQMVYEGEVKKFALYH